MQTNIPETPHADFIAGLDSADYDTEAMRIDDRHGNFSPDQADDYRHEAIVQASILNGQHAQARRQCARFGLDYGTQRRAAQGGA
jgi:hypothetical protein